MGQPNIEHDRNLGLALCTMALMLDGLDNQLLGLVMPSLIADWHLDRGAFAPFIIVTVVLMSIGTCAGGWLGDKYGRKPVLIGAMVVLGAFTLASGAVISPLQLLLTRGCAALGMGGVMPNATALLAEYVSANRRSLAVSIGVSGIPLGGVCGGIVGSLVLPLMGWRAMFVIAGVATILAAAVLALRLSESPALRKEQAEIAAHKRTLISSETEHSGLKLSIFSREYRRDTLAMWGALFFSMLGVYSMVNWLPTLLSQAGFGLAIASLGLSAFNLGGIIGSVGIAAAMDRFGSRSPLAATGFAGGAVALLAIPMISTSQSILLALIAMTAMGFCIAGLQAALIALSAQVYPTLIRSTGMGAMMAFGRLGALASSITGTAILGFGSKYFLLAMGLAALVAGLTGLLVRHGSTVRRPVDELAPLNR